MGVFWISSKFAKQMRKWRIWKPMFPWTGVNMCQKIRTNHLISAQSWIRKFSVVTLYLMQIRITPSPPPDPICWNVAMANANIASLPGCHVPKRKEWHLFVYDYLANTCCFLFIIHCVAMSMRHNCWCSSTAVGVLSTSRLSTLWRLNLRKWVSSMGKAQDGNLEWLLPEKVKGEPINGTPSGCKRPS